MRALSTSERRWVTWVSALLLLLTLVPLGVAAARTPAGHDFGGFVYEARDGDSYVGKTMEGVEGHWLYRDPYTSEKQPASFILAPYLFLGQADRVLQLPVPILLQLARLKAGMSQRELAERAGVPVTMISAYERDQRQPTLSTLLRLLRAAGFDLRLHLAAYDPHDDILAGLEAGRSESERLRRDRQLQAWRQASPAEDVA